jgi:hypothetical protein
VPKLKILSWNVDVRQGYRLNIVIMTPDSVLFLHVCVCVCVSQGTCECDNKLPVSIKCEELLD